MAVEIQDAKETQREIEVKHPLPVGVIIKAYTPVGRSALHGTPLRGFVSAAVEGVREWVSPAGRKDYFYTIVHKGRRLEVPQTDVSAALESAR